MEEITLSKFLKYCYQRKIHFKRSWRIQLACILFDYKQDPYYPFPVGKEIHFLDEDGVEFKLKGIKPLDSGVLLHHRIKFTLETDDLPNAPSKLDTTFGIWLMNAIITSPFENKLEYFNGQFGGKVIAKIFFNAKESGVLDRYNDTVKVKEVLDQAYCCTIGDMDWIGKSLNRKMYKEDKVKTKMVKELLKENEGNLQDTLVQAKIDSALIKRSKEHYKAIGADEYVYKDKIHGDAIKRTEGVFGSEADLEGNPSTFITTPLKNGLDMDNLPAYINSARAGSVGRGSLTALGGAEVNNDYRVLWEHTILAGDCKATKGVRVLITKENADNFIEAAMVGKEGFLGVTEVRSYIGKIVELRTPSHCKFGNKLTCSVCCGKAGVGKPNAVATSVSRLDSNIMYKFMASMHVSAKRIVKVNLSDFSWD